MIILEGLFIGHFGHSWPQEKAAKPIGLVLAVWSLGHLAGITSSRNARSLEVQRRGAAPASVVASSWKMTKRGH